MGKNMTTYHQIPDYVSQSKQIATHLMAGNTLSGIEALHLFRCRDLPKRISELRKTGLRIKGTWNRDAKGSRYMRYELDRSREIQNGDLVRVTSIHPRDSHFQDRASIVGLVAKAKHIQPFQKGSYLLEQYPDLRHYVSCYVGTYFFLAVQIERA
jgi:hypothetical protein